jgi:hypothetical protein
MKIWESEHTFEHPWETVVQAAMRKYPNPLNTAVKSTDVVEREVREDGVLTSERLLSTEWNIPNWVTGLIGLRNPSYGFEYSEVDPVRKTFRLKSRNLNCTSFVSVDETLEYKADPSDANKTHLAQTAVVTMKGIPLIDYCENLMTQTIHNNASKGRDGLEWVIGNVTRELKELDHLATSSLFQKESLTD